MKNPVNNHDILQINHYQSDTSNELNKGHSYFRIVTSSSGMVKTYLLEVLLVNIRLH
ncbi:MAG: hypothetical protein HRT47_13085 [Candidatus Caenarcaniphilales bacterium]|nr:hypothetical protein [Candidatus Caenarcaniphilales bacterium]